MSLSIQRQQVGVQPLKPMQQASNGQGPRTTQGADPSQDIQAYLAQAYKLQTAMQTGAIQPQQSSTQGSSSITSLPSSQRITGQPGQGLSLSDLQGRMQVQPLKNPAQSTSVSTPQAVGSIQKTFQESTSLNPRMQDLQQRSE